ncbi:MAG: UDP-N-acetylmuramate dehydrogenase [Solirubrobacterales bacterium]|nr:UDP-N-acetylmuramate dehydrogenase [Solirubrobacterales bacterium]HRV59466.1 UDP-N-acetylmuramate dehydrogenase [Solirubrobacterales bacterium]
MAEAGEHVDLAPLTSLRLGGPAERLVKVTDTAELIRLVQAADAEREPVFFLAGGSNVVIADEGVPGTTIWIRTTGIEERELEDGRLSLTVAAGEPWDDLVSRSVDSGLAGIECLSGIPGSVGATPVQNVGAYGQEVSSTIASVLVLDRESGQVGPMEASQCGFGYRSSRFKGDSRFLVLAVEFILDPSDESAPVAYAQLADALEVETGERVPLSVARETVLDLRRSKSMVLDPDDPDSVSAGSFFTNPLLDLAGMAELNARAEELFGPDNLPPAYPAPEGMAKTSAAWLIERAGFSRGFGEGPIGLSHNHTLAIVNRGGGTTAELVSFARLIAGHVEEVFGVALKPEPVFVGHSW